MKENILLVDDDPFISQLYRRKLEQAGYSVDVVMDGKTALKALQTVHPDLILLDLMLPDVHGLQVLSVIRSKPALNDVPVIVFSSNCDDKTIEQTMRNGATRYCCKANTTPAGMVQAVGETLDIRREYKSVVQEAQHAPPRNDLLSAIPASVEMPELDDAMPRKLLAFLDAPDPARQQEALLELYQGIQPQLKITHQEPCIASRAQLGRALEGLFEDLYAHPGHINDSTTRTLSSALDLLRTLCLKQRTPTPSLSPPLLVAALHRDALFGQRVTAPLKRCLIRVVATTRVPFLQALLEENVFDLVLVDRDDPEETFALGRTIQAAPGGKNTPILATLPLAEMTPGHGRMVPGIEGVAAPLNLEELVLKIVTLALRAGMDMNGN